MPTVREQLRVHRRWIREMPGIAWNETDRWFRNGALLLAVVAFVDRPLAVKIVDGWPGIPWWIGLIALGLLAGYAALKAIYNEFSELEREGQRLHRDNESLSEDNRALREEARTLRRAAPTNVTINNHFAPGAQSGQIDWEKMVRAALNSNALSEEQTPEAANEPTESEEGR